jgi:hypothetical protein
MAWHWRQMNLGVVGMMGVLPTHTISGFFVRIVLPQRYFRRLPGALFLALLAGFPGLRRAGSRNWPTPKRSGNKPTKSAVACGIRCRNESSILVDVTGIEPATPCLQRTGVPSNSSVHDLVSNVFNNLGNLVFAPQKLACVRLPELGRVGIRAWRPSTLAV